jgi:hypothetical protein
MGKFSQHVQYLNFHISTFLRSLTAELWILSRLLLIDLLLFVTRGVIKLSRFMRTLLTQVDTERNSRRGQKSMLKGWCQNMDIILRS